MGSTEIGTILFFGFLFIAWGIYVARFPWARRRGSVWAFDLAALVVALLVAMACGPFGAILKGQGTPGFVFRAIKLATSEWLVSCAGPLATALVGLALARYIVFIGITHDDRA